MFFSKIHLDDINFLKTLSVLKSIVIVKMSIMPLKVKATNFVIVFYYLIFLFIFQVGKVVFPFICK